MSESVVVKRGNRMDTDVQAIRKSGVHTEGGRGFLGSERVDSRGGCGYRTDKAVKGSTGQYGIAQ